MITDDEFERIKMMIVQLLDERGLKKLPSANAARQQRYRDRNKNVTAQKAKALRLPSKKRNGSVTVELPEWLPKTQWDAWIEARTKGKKAPTDFALKLAIGKLDELRGQGHHPAAVLAQSAFHGWIDLFPVKERH